MARTAQQEPKTDFARRMRQARAFAGLRQMEVCKALQISQGTLSRLELSGEGSLFLVAFARLYRVNPEWLFEGKGDMKKSPGLQCSPEAEQLARAFDMIEEPNIRRRVHALCMATIENQDLPDPGNPAPRVRRVSLPSTAAPRQSPVARRQKRVE